MIHLLKYAYLEYLAYARQHNGETFTGLPWKFYLSDHGPFNVFIELNPPFPASAQSKGPLKVKNTTILSDDQLKMMSPNLN